MVPLLLSVLVGEGCGTTTSLCLGGRSSGGQRVVVEHPSPTKTERSSGRAPRTSLCLGG